MDFGVWPMKFNAYVAHREDRVIVRYPAGQCRSCGEHLLYSARAWCSNTCKMRGRPVYCVDCGGPAWERPHGEPGERRCKHCAARANRTQWTRELVVDAILRWTATHGRPPSKAEWATSNPGYPSLMAVKRAFADQQGPWSAALKAAGVRR